MLTPIGNDKGLIAVVDGDALARTIAEHVGPGGRVVVAEPTATSVLEAIAAAGARWVDAGRDHRFRIDAAGWRAALRFARPALAVVGAPDEPTSTLADPGRVREAREAGAVVLLDRRAARRRGQARRVAALARALSDVPGWVFERPHGAAVWARVPGLPSLEIARRAAHPLVVGSAAWTWRDAVRIAAPEPDDLAALLAALWRAL